MDSRSGIGYVAYCPARGTFLGRVGEWYTDIRLATVYAEPRQCRMAINRCESKWPVACVPVTMTVAGQDMEGAVELVGVEPAPPTVAKAPEEAKPAPKPALKPATKAA